MNLQRFRLAVGLTGCAWLVIVILAGCPAHAQDPAAGQLAEPKAKELTPKEVFDLPLEKLGTVPARVPTASGFDAPTTSVTRALELPAAGLSESTTVGRSPAAIYVITDEDIRRSGQRTIPDLLRMVPGMNVARVDSNIWAVSARGFNDRFANKLLVQIDGRSVYTPLFAGTFWDERDVLLEDIERIEVIRGPGATLWGANAVNGIISIITKPADQTQGLLLRGGTATDERGFGAFRYGGRLAPQAFYRVWFNYFHWDNGDTFFGTEGNDGWEFSRGGFRIDWRPDTQNSFMLQGDMYTGAVGETEIGFSLTPPFTQFLDNSFDKHGGFILGRWTHVIDDDSDLSLQFWYDRTDRKAPLFAESRDTIDVDFQHRFPLNDRNEMIWGLGYRVTTDHIRDSFNFTFNRKAFTANLFSAFLQDDLTVVEDRLHFIFGTKLEHNDYVGFQIQPSFRWLWTPDDRQTVWAAVSRAVRTPSRAEEDISLPTNIISPPLPLTDVRTFGSPLFTAEKLWSYEAGYRITPSDRVLIDITGFFNDYDDLRTGQGRLPPFFSLTPLPHVVVPILISNAGLGETYGVELAANWRVTDYWQLRGGYTWLDMELHTLPGSTDVNFEGNEGRSPHNQFHLRSFLDLARRWQFDTAVYYVDNLADLAIPHYIRFDARIAYLPRDNVEMILGLQNLFDPRHPEFRQPVPAVVGTEAERAVYGVIRVRY